MAKARPDHGKSAHASSGLTTSRRWTQEGADAYESVTWERRTARITTASGQTLFEQKNVETPAFWSQHATNVVASKYFRGTPGTASREHSLRQIIGRVVDTIVRWGRDGDYFSSDADAQAFADELVWLLLNQHLSFNSPVWFNVGVPETKPQCSACFINAVEDSMESIMSLAQTEALLFKYGSGSGTNVSTLRSSKEQLSGGGQATGPVSFMRGYDAFAGTVKSGGKTRRAAKMVILNADHPDIETFVTCKASEERKARVLIDAGYDGSFGGEAYQSVFFQNANHSVRVSDEFMQAVVDNGDWTTHAIVTGQPVETMPARRLWHRIAEAAWECGDPGVQFDTTINNWHTCAGSGRINASNPCAEFMFLDDTACNLASLNLLKFVRDGAFDVEAFEHAVELTILAQEILVSNASYPTERIASNSDRYRPLGLGYANLGALLMSAGLPYDSDEGRQYAASITALMGGRAYAASARIAQHRGAFAGYADNKDAMVGVIARHQAAADQLADGDVARAAQLAWRRAADLGERHGYRNSQVTVLAPTGTIAFMMDCDTTGVEPDIALVKYKQLAGGGMMRIVNNAVPAALQALGYSHPQCSRILEYIEQNDTIEGAPGLNDEHLPVFDCAFRAASGSRSISPMGHVEMMAAVQPFLSGAISKTVNMPADATVEDIGDIYLRAWTLGLKAIAVYRDGCKRSQPLSTSADSKTPSAPLSKPQRRRLPDERHSITHKFDIGGHEGYITVGKYPDGKPGEIFVLMAKQGSTVGGLMDAFATSVSLSLQYGVPLDVLAKKYVNMRFEPSGFTRNPEIPMAKSIMDYIFRWLQSRFPPEVEEQSSQAHGPKLEVVAPGTEQVNVVFIHEADAPTCPDCGTLMVRNGACHKCLNCGETSGCS